MRIYDHPFNSDVTIIEIEKLDEKKSFLENIIDGFNEYGTAYPSASCGGGEKQVIYVDGRRRSMFNIDETDILCDITVRLAELTTPNNEKSVADQSMSIAEAVGHSELIERLLVQPPEYFDTFKPVRKVA